MSDRKTPWHYLKEEYRKFAAKTCAPRTRSMWHYPKARLAEGWALTDLWERTQAAQQLGYDVVLEAKDDGLHVRYVEKRPDWPSTL